MLEFINFLRGLSFFIITGKDAISFKNEIASFATEGEDKTWGSLTSSLWLGESTVKLVTRKSPEQIEKDFEEADRWIQKSYDPWQDSQGIEDCQVEAYHLRKEEVVEWIDLHELFRDTAVEVGIIVLDDDKCWDDSIVITEQDWDLVISRVIAKLQ